MKNRHRSKYTFANINLLGKCNFDCRWCLGKDLPEFYEYNHINTHFSLWKNFDKFLDMVKNNDIKQIYITGQNTDSLLYRELGELIYYLQDTKGFCVGLRTNGWLAKDRMDLINNCNTCLGDAVSYTVLTLNKKTHLKIVGHSYIPKWDWIFENTKVPYRVAIVIDRYNFHEFFEIVDFIAQYPSVKYIQARRISTDTRKKEFRQDIEIYEDLYNLIKNSNQFPLINRYENAESFNIYGKECSFWRTVSTTANSMNYHTNGVVSPSYFIIEGYLKNKGKWLNNE